MKRSLDDSLLPMINVVFLLLIFFLVAGQLAPTPPLPVTPPESLHAPAQESRAAAVEVAVSAAGELKIGDETAAWDTLTVQLQARAVTLETPVTVRADRQLPAARLLALLRAIKAAGVGKVTLLSVQEGVK